MMNNGQALLPGIIGLAQKTNIEYYRLMTKRAAELSPEHDLQTLMHTVDFALCVRQLRAGRLDRFTDAIVQSAQILVRAEADFLVISSNTSHAALPTLKAQFDIPIVDIREVAAHRLVSAGVTRVGLIATTMTLEEELYNDPFSAAGLEIVTPEPDVCQRVDEIIFGELVHGIGDGRAPCVVSEVIADLLRRSDAVALACTDLTHIADAVAAPFVFDTTRLHAEEAARFAVSGSPTV
jgi:aspartate racemase